MENDMKKNSGLVEEKPKGNDTAAIGTKKDRIKLLKEEHNHLEKAIKRDKLIQKILLLSGFLMLFYSTFVLDLSAVTNAYENPPLTRILAILLGVILASTSLIFSPYENKMNLREVTHELDLLDTGKLTTEAKAEELFNHHHLELARFYDEKLLQSFLVFRLGFATIIASFVFMGLTFYLINKYVAIAPQTTILIGAVGAIGVILSDFVAVVFLKMHADIVKSGNEYHGRFVQTQHFYFANYLVSKVDDKVERERGLVNLALGMIQTDLPKSAEEPVTAKRISSFRKRNAARPSIADELIKLKQLHDQELLDDNEFNNEKRKLLS